MYFLSNSARLIKKQAYVDVKFTLFPSSSSTDTEVFPAPAAVSRIVLFANAAVKKGVIKIKGIVGGANGYVVFDMKVQEQLFRNGPFTEIDSILQPGNCEAKLFTRFEANQPG